MSSVFDEILDTLKDGKWHSFHEILTGCRHSNQNQLEAVLSLLAESGFLHRKMRYLGSTRTARAKLSEPMLRFLNRLNELKSDSLVEAENAIVK